MRAVYVIHAPEDLDFVRQTLIRQLPSLGFGEWLSSQHPQADLSQGRAMAASAAILVVVSSASAAAPNIQAQCACALASGRPIVPIWMSEGVQGVEEVFAALQTRPRIDLREAAGAAPGDYLRRELWAMLPPVA